MDCAAFFVASPNPRLARVLSPSPVAFNLTQHHLNVGRLSAHIFGDILAHFIDYERSRSVFQRPIYNMVCVMAREESRSLLLPCMHPSLATREARFGRKHHRPQHLDIATLYGKPKEAIHRVALKSWEIAPVRRTEGESWMRAFDGRSMLSLRLANVHDRIKGDSIDGPSIVSNHVHNPIKKSQACFQVEAAHKQSIFKDRFRYAHRADQSHYGRCQCLRIHSRILSSAHGPLDNAHLCVDARMRQDWA